MSKLIKRTHKCGELRKENKTVILVTPSMDNITKFCTRGILLENGKIIDEGSPKKIANAYKNLFKSH